MRVWENRDAWGIENLVLGERPTPSAPGPGQVLVQVKAAACNYRDVATITTGEPLAKFPQIPLSDAAGDVVAVGAGVTRVGVGDRVCPIFFPDWITGLATATNRIRQWGAAGAPGVLQEFLLLDAEAVVKFPAHLSYAEAACLPCAGVTAWRAMAVDTDVKPGDVVVVQGTGGVSLFALQFAKMQGASVIVTSSSDEKLARAKELGADDVINYATTPQWGKRVLELTGRRGADHIVEVGGGGTINQSLVAAKVNGAILVVGVLGGASQELMMPAIFGKNLRLRGITVGSRDHFEAMNRAFSATGARPLVAQIFPFAQAPQALAAQASNAHLGKICIDFSN